MSAAKLMWEAFVMYDPQSGERMGIYGSREAAEEDCPRWKEEGFIVEMCIIKLVKRHLG